MQFTREIFVHRASADTLAVGPTAAFGQAGLDGLESGEEAHARLRLARLDPAAMGRLRSAWQEWRGGPPVNIADDHLIEHVSAEMRSGRLSGVLLPSSAQDIRPKLQGGGASRASRVEGQVHTLLTSAVACGETADRRGRWQRLIEPASRLNRHVTVLTAWARNALSGPAAIAEVFLEAEDAYAPSATLFEAASELHAVLSQLGRARSDHVLKRAAEDLARLILSLEVDRFLDILRFAANRGTDGTTLGRPMPERVAREPVQQRENAVARRPAQAASSSTRRPSEAARGAAAPGNAGTSGGAGSAPSSGATGPAGAPGAPPGIGDKLPEAAQSALDKLAQDPCGPLQKAVDEANKLRAKQDEIIQQARDKVAEKKKEAEVLSVAGDRYDEAASDIAKAEKELEDKIKDVQAVEDKVKKAEDALAKCRQAFG